MKPTIEMFLQDLENISTWDKFIETCEKGKKLGYIYRVPVFIGISSRKLYGDFLSEQNLNFWRFFGFKSDKCCEFKCDLFDSKFYWSSKKEFKLHVPNDNLYLYGVKFNYMKTLPLQIPISKKIEYYNSLKNRMDVEKHIVLESLFSFNGQFLTNENINEWLFSVLDKNNNFITKEQPFDKIGYWVSKQKLLFHLFTQEESCTVVCIKMCVSKSKCDVDFNKKFLELKNESIKKTNTIEKNLEERCDKLEKNIKEYSKSLIEERCNKLEKVEKNLEEYFKFLVEERCDKLEEKYNQLEKKMATNLLQFENENLILKKELKKATELLSNAIIME
jgi:hypothetical protein